MKIVVYSTNTCPACHALKEWLTGLNISFENKNVSMDVDARNHLMLHYGTAVPVIEVNGVGIIGFRKEKIWYLIKYMELKK